MPIRGVIFDMDGTITEPYLDFVSMKLQVNIGERDMLEYLDSEIGHERDRVHRVLLDFEAEGASRAQLNPGARAVLEQLAARQIPTGLLTRNSRQSVSTICTAHGLCFDVVKTREDRPYKPAPEPVWQMAANWGVPPRDVALVGDYKWDLMCAQNAGCASVLLLNDEVMPDWAQEATYVIHRLEDLLPLVESHR